MTFASPEHRCSGPSRPLLRRLAPLALAGPGDAPGDSSLRAWRRLAGRAEGLLPPRSSSAPRVDRSALGAGHEHQPTCRQPSAEAGQTAENAVLTAVRGWLDRRAGGRALAGAAILQKRSSECPPSRVEACDTRRWFRSVERVFRGDEETIAVCGGRFGALRPFSPACGHFVRAWLFGLLPLMTGCGPFSPIAALVARSRPRGAIGRE